MKKSFLLLFLLFGFLPGFAQKGKMLFPQSFALDESFFENLKLRKYTAEFQVETGLDATKGVVTDRPSIRYFTRKIPEITPGALEAVYYESYAHPEKSFEDAGLVVYQYKNAATLAQVARKGIMGKDNRRVLYTDRYLILVWSDQEADVQARTLQKIENHFLRTTDAAPVVVLEDKGPPMQVAVTEAVPSLNLGFGYVPNALLSPEEAQVLNEQIGRLEADYGTRTALQALPEGMNIDAVPEHYIPSVLGDATNRLRNHVLLLFDPKTGENILLFGPANSPYLSRNTTVWQADFRKVSKEKGFYPAADALLQKVAAAYKKVPSAKVPSLKIDVAGLETKAYDFMEAKAYDSAIFYYRQFLKAYPQNSRGYFNITWMYNTTGRQEEAIRVAQEALKNVGPEKYGQFYRVIGSSYTDLKQYPEGEKYLLMALEEDPDDALSRYNLGYNYFITHNYAAAVPTLQKALAQTTGDEFNLYDTYFYLGTSLRALDRREEALSYFDQAIEGSPFESYYFNKAQTLIDLERYPEAIATATEGLRHNAASGNLYFKRAQAYRHKKEFLLAQKDLEAAARLSPDDPDVLLDMGVLYTDRNEIAQALSAYHRLLRTDSKEKDKAYSNMAGIFATNPETRDSALSYYRKAIAANPENSTFYYNLGNLYREEKAYQEAIAQYRKALALKQDEAKFYINLASTYKELDNTREAISAVQNGLATLPNDYSLNALRADLAYYKEADYPVAIRHATQALTAQPDGGHTLQLLTIRGNARQMTGAFNEALYDYLDIYKKIPPSDTEGRAGILSNIGYCYLELKDWKNAEKYFDQSLASETVIDPLIGKMILYYHTQNRAKLEATRAAAVALEPRLTSGMSGLEAVEAEGYFFTPAQKEVLKEIFRP